MTASLRVKGEAWKELNALKNKVLVCWLAWRAVGFRASIGDGQ